MEQAKTTSGNLTTVQIDKQYVPLIKELARRDKRTMRQYLEVLVLERAHQAGILPANK